MLVVNKKKLIIQCRKKLNSVSVWNVLWNELENKKECGNEIRLLILNVSSSIQIDIHLFFLCESVSDEKAEILQFFKIFVLNFDLPPFFMTFGWWFSRFYMQKVLLKTTWWSNSGNNNNKIATELCLCFARTNLMCWRRKLERRRRRRFTYN